jgi:hypothetical protein
MTVSWHIESCSVAEVDRRFSDAYCLHHQGNEYEDDSLLRYGAV